MSIYHPSSYFKKLIKEKFNRAPLHDSTEYLDLEYFRSVMHEEGTAFLGKPSKPKIFTGHHRPTWDEMVDLNVRMGRLLRNKK